MKENESKTTEYLENNRVDYANGLTEANVKARITLGKVNSFTEKPNKTISEIVKTNIFTIFNFLCFSLAGLVLLTGQLVQIFFIVPVIANLLIGVIQEIRAKLTIEKLSLLDQAKVTVIRERKENRYR